MTLTSAPNQVGSSLMGWSAETSFVQPVPPNAEASLHITALADMGETYIDGAQYHWMEPFAINTTNYAEQHLLPHPLARNRAASHPRGRVMSSLSRRAASDENLTDLVLHIGDLSYATGYASEWDRFLSQIEPLASRVPYMTAQGNHERDWTGSGSAIGQRSGSPWGG
jgi:hypothetical protein